MGQMSKSKMEKKVLVEGMHVECNASKAKKPMLHTTSNSFRPRKGFSVGSARCRTCRLFRIRCPLNIPGESGTRLGRFDMTYLG